MGNEAMGMAAIAAGVNVVCGYPGTPSTEVLETVARHNPGNIHVEWSTNEKAAMEVAAGAAMSGARCLVTCKQVGLNVASDPLMTLAYLGVKGGMVVLVADDPGPISSQTEQDTRTFAQFARVPVFDPSSPEEAYDMMKDAFELSERHGSPVFLRPTTRVCHACAPLDPEAPAPHAIAGFHKDPKWVIFPRQALASHLRLNEELPRIAEEFSDYPYNAVYDVTLGNATDKTYAADSILPAVRRGIVTGGVSDAYATEALNSIDAPYRLMHVATPFPFPEQMALDFLDGLDEVLVLEELDPFLERQLLQLVGAHHLTTTIRGKLTGDAKAAGENSVESAAANLRTFFGLPAAQAPEPQTPPLPMRPPVLCAGCPHRASFYAVKRALNGRKAVFSGDIGCYTLGNAAPLDMVDTCLCMGAGITQAQGIHWAQPDTVNIAFVGDSTFFASGITGMVNAVYNSSDMTLVVLDNATTAMTGKQPHPGTGIDAMGRPAPKLSIEQVLHGIGVETVLKANPLDLRAATAAVQQAVGVTGPSAVIFESPCVQLQAPDAPLHIVADKCTNCQKCIRQLGCPGLVIEDGKLDIDPSLCNGCGLCTLVCSFGAIAGKEDAQ